MSARTQEKRGISSSRNILTRWRRIRFRNNDVRCRKIIDLQEITHNKSVEEFILAELEYETVVVTKLVSGTNEQTADFLDMWTDRKPGTCIRRIHLNEGAVDK